MIAASSPLSTAARAAHAAQNFGRRDPVDHRERVVAARRRQAKRDVLEHFDQHAAQPESHHLAEARIVRGADDHFLAAGEHLLDFDPGDLGVGLVRARAGDDLFVGALGLGRAPHVEHHASRFGLVQDVGGDDFHHHWKADGTRSAAGLGGGRHGRRFGQRDRASLA